ncbi:ABC transporter ATP-binding protein [Rhodopseudomonas palustris]|uniref:ABC transporter ATP-binding protein n=1 Tax=Rhodopseudomonas palustris TaxID=1076 RepID=UPI002ACEC9A8|nr:ABC transporter ATP-binding protein [Rhodopseudomonas palustris]WQG99830.1 ABC transporter ATP-binding protein [Rhodopseudomonas palustris]
MLELRNISAGYGPVDVLEGVSLRVPTGACVCLIGANGAGKTTTLSAICGLVVASSGDLLLEGESIRRVPTDSIVRRGVSLVPEGRRVVSNMSVEDNLLVGAYTRHDDQIGTDLESVYRRFGRLRERRKQFAGQMSGGEQQMLAIGRALMARPKLLLLDEPSMGLAPQIVNDIFRTIREINEAGTTVLLVEQNARKALSIASYGYVLESGMIKTEGTARDLMTSPQIVSAYLGDAS